MIATRRSRAAIQPRLFDPDTRGDRHERQPERPIVAAVHDRTARTTAETAARLARELNAPVIFVHVRRRPAAVLGRPLYERRLARDFFHARQALDVALATAAAFGVRAHGEILEGDPGAEIAGFAQTRQARLLVVGSRRRRLGPSVSRNAIREARLPVVVAA